MQLKFPVFGRIRHAFDNAGLDSKRDEFGFFGPMGLLMKNTNFELFFSIFP